MKRLITVLASIALLGTLFAGAPKPVFASVSEIYYIGANGPSDTGCGRPDIQISTDEFIDGDFDGGLRDNYDDVYYNDMDYALQWALTLVDDGDIIQLCDTYETDGVDTDYWYFTDLAVEWNGDQNANPSIVDPIDLTIQGLGPDETILNGDGWRMFNFTNVNLTLKDMSLYNGNGEGDGYGEDGGAVRLVGGSLTVDNVDFTAFSAGDSGDGQFIYVEGADLTVNDSSFEHESWYYLSEFNEGSGGAIYSTPDNTSGVTTTISIDNTVFDGLGAQDYGGAITAYCADMTISDSLFEDNTAGISGGAIYAYGGSECATLGSLTIEEGTLFRGNHIHDDFGGGGSGVGGAIHSIHQPVTISNSRFGEINGSGTFNGNYTSEGNGGALFVDGTSGTVLTIEDTKFFDNSSGQSGGAISTRCVNISIDGDDDGSTDDDPIPGNVSTKFIGNGASGDGGAIRLDDEGCYDGNPGTTDFVNASISGAAFVDNTSGGQGGVLATSQSGFNWLKLVTVETSSFLRNQSLNSDGGVFNSDFVDIEVSDSAFMNNKAKRGGVAEMCSGNIGFTRSLFLSNRAKEGQGGVVITSGNCGRSAWDVEFSQSFAFGNSAFRNGGVLYSDNSQSILVFEDSTFLDNTSGGSGGVAYVDDAAVEIRGSTFESNEAYNEGGAFDFRDGRYLLISESVFRDNSSGAFGNWDGRDGGAIDYETNGANIYLGVFDSEFQNNTATGNGGAIWFEVDSSTGTFDIRRTTFEGNLAYGSGGSLWVNLDNAGDLLIDRSTFTGNTAWDDGGAINQDTEDKYTFVRITNSAFTDNSAGSDGGALDLTDRAVLTNNSFVGNNATTGAGGAVELNAGNPDESLPYLFTVTRNTFRVNSAGTSFDAGDGGALAVSGSALITSNTFTSNVAYGVDYGDGGAIATRNVVDDNVTTISKNIFSGNYAGNDGGAVYAMDGVVIASNTFSSNTVQDDGGAVWAGDENVFVTKNTFSRNYAFDNGGGLYANEVAFPLSRITDNLFDSNGASDHGGAMWIDDDEGIALAHRVVISSNRIIRNTAEKGAGLYTQVTGAAGAPLFTGIVRNTFERNIASQNGGAIMMEYRGGAYSNARAALQALKKAVKNNRYKANKANLDRATGDIGGVAISFEVMSAEVEVPEVRLPEAPKAK